MRKEERAKKRRKGLITFASVTSAIAIFAITMLILCSTVIPMQSVTVDGISFSKNVDGSYYVKSCDLRSEDIIIPSTVRGRQVTKIGDMAFSDKKIKSITLPDSLTEIGNNAFWGCGTQTIIGDEAFWDDEEITIYTPAGSFAESYAKENEIHFQTIFSQEDTF